MPDSQPLEAARLFAGCRSTSEAERARAFDCLGRFLYRSLRPRVADDPRREHLAADAVQEALVTIWRALEEGRGPDQPASFVAWAHRVASNKLLDLNRRLEPGPSAGPPRRVALSRQVRLDAPASDGERELAERLPDPSAPEPEAAAAFTALRDVVLEIARLPAVSEASRTVLLRGYIDGWTDDDLARHLSTSRGNVHVIRCRDLARVRADDAFMARLRAVWS